MADELIDIFDENNKFTGKRELKSVAHRKGLWHRAAHIWIYDHKGEILIQLRKKTKEYFPGVWDISCAGHVSAGEDPCVSAIRELEEELGIKAKASELKFYEIRKKNTEYDGLKNFEFYYIYFLKFCGKISDLKLQEEEVEEVRFISAKELLYELKMNPKAYIPHGRYWEEVLEQVHKRSTSE